MESPRVWHHWCLILFKAPEATAASWIKWSTGFIKIRNSVSYRLYDLSVQSAIHMLRLLYIGRRRKKKIWYTNEWKNQADKFWFILWKCNVMIFCSSTLIVTIIFWAFQVTCLLILVADMLVYALYLSPVAFDYLPFTIAPYIRVVLFMLNFR